MINIKAMSFGCKPDDMLYRKEILPRLLMGEKKQTIRPAYRVEDGKVILKKSNFKVGDDVRFFWKQRSTYKNFCFNCGRGIRKKLIYSQSFSRHKQQTSNWFCDECGIGCVPFSKILREVKLKKIFYIQMFFRETKTITEHWIKQLVGESWQRMDIDEVEHLIKQDGFGTHQNRTWGELSNLLEFFRWFDSEHKLEVPKYFEVRVW